MQVVGYMKWKCFFNSFLNKFKELLLFNSSLSEFQNLGRVFDGMVLKPSEYTRFVT